MMERYHLWQKNCELPKDHVVYIYEAEDDITIRYYLNKGRRPSWAGTAFCLALACCACDRVPASLFYRSCLPRRQWHASGALAQSEDHLRNLAPWLCRLFYLPQTAKVREPGTGSIGDARHDNTQPISRDPERNLPISQSDQMPLANAENALGDQFIDPASVRSKQIPLEFIGVPPDFVDARGPSHLVYSNDLQGLLDAQVVTIILSEVTVYFTLDRTWKRVILRSASERLRIKALILLTTLATYSTPTPYTEPLWQLYQAQLEDIFELTVIPFLSVQDLVDFKAWDHKMHR